MSDTREYGVWAVDGDGVAAMARFESAVYGPNGVTCKRPTDKNQRQIWEREGLTERLYPWSTVLCVDTFMPGRICSEERPCGFCAICRERRAAGAIA